MLQRTPLAPFIGQEEFLYTRLQMLETQQFFTDKETFEPNTSTAYFTYLMVPHRPHVFTENGELTPMQDRWNIQDPNAYLGQFIYTTSVILEMMESITTNDPDAVIVLQSDHGSRNLYNKEGENAIHPQDKRNFLNAVYFRGELLDVDGMTGLNTIRTVLTKLFDNVDLPVLEVPENPLVFGTVVESSGEGGE